MVEFAMEALTWQLVEVSLKEETQESKQMSTPGVELLYKFNIFSYCD